MLDSVRPVDDGLACVFGCSFSRPSPSFSPEAAGTRGAPVAARFFDSALV
jgi:hypothetical protein